MIAYHKRNGAFIYNQSQSEILIHILEVVLSKKHAFWLYVCLNECILPLNFYTNTLYPQAYLEYTRTLVKDFDDEFFSRCGEAINMFCLKSYYSLFTNLEIKDESNEVEAKKCNKLEIAYFMIDLLFLIGDPKKSKTMLDNPVVNGEFVVGEMMRQNQGKNAKKTKNDEVGHLDKRVRIDRTSQLLVAMSITIAERVKKWSLRDFEPGKQQSGIRLLNQFEDVVNK